MKPIHNRKMKIRVRLKSLYHKKPELSELSIEDVLPRICVQCIYYRRMFACGHPSVKQETLIDPVTGQEYVPEDEKWKNDDPHDQHDVFIMGPGIGISMERPAGMPDCREINPHGDCQLWERIPPVQVIQVTSLEDVLRQQGLIPPDPNDKKGNK